MGSGFTPFPARGAARAAGRFASGLQVLLARCGPPLPSLHTDE